MAVRLRFRPRAGEGAPALAVATILVAFPLVITVGVAFGLVSIGFSTVEPGVAAIRDLLGDGSFWSAMARTALVAVLGTVGAVVMGTTLAFLLIRTSMPGAGSRWLGVVPLLSFLLPAVLIYFAWQILYSDRVGLVNIFLRALPVVGPSGDTGPVDLIHPLWLVLAMTVYLTPFVFVTVRGSLMAASPELEQAALVSGASLWRVIRTVTLPLVKPAIAAGALLGFVLGIGVYTIPAMIRVKGWSPISVELKQAAVAAPPRYDRAASLALTMLVISLVALYLRRRVTGSAPMAPPLRQSASISRRLELGGARWPSFVVFVAYGLFAGLLPLFAVVTLSLRRFWSTSFSLDAFSFDNFRNMGDLAPGASTALMNSVLVAVLAATISVVLGVWLARSISRTKRGRLIEVMTFAPAAIPPLIVGLSILMVCLRYVPSFYATPIPVILAYTIVLLPFSVQIPLAALRRVPHDLELASSVSGSSRLRTFCRVVLPLIWTDLVVLWMLLATIMLREVEASVMLSDRSFGLAGTELLEMWESGAAPVAAAFGIYILATTAALLVVVGCVVGAVRLVLAARARSRVAGARAAYADLVARS